MEGMSSCGAVPASGGAMDASTQTPYPYRSGPPSAEALKALTSAPLSSAAITAVKKSHESETKRKLIKRQLFLMFHSIGCQKRGPDYHCSLPNCAIIKNVMNHLKTCTEVTSCPFPHCCSTRRIIAHWNQCFRAGCDVCSSLRRHPLSVRSSQRPLNYSSGPRVQDKSFRHVVPTGGERSGSEGIIRRFIVDMSQSKMTRPVRAKEGCGPGPHCKGCSGATRQKAKLYDRIPHMPFHGPIPPLHYLLPNRPTLDSGLQNIGLNGVSAQWGQKEWDVYDRAVQKSNQLNEVIQGFDSMVLGSVQELEQ